MLIGLDCSFYTEDDRTFKPRFLNTLAWLYCLGGRFKEARERLARSYEIRGEKKKKNQ